MRTIITLAFLLFIIPNTAYTCDVCGCGFSSNYMGISPEYRANNIGLRYSLGSTHSKHLPSLYNTQTTSDETFNSMELLGRYYVGNRLMLQGIVPFHYFHKTVSDGTTNELKGLGDISVLANYLLINTGDSMVHRSRHLLQFGGGVKTHTGKSNNLLDNVVNPNFQLGTGALAFIVNGLYTFRYKNWGNTIEAAYQYHLTNRHDFQFGQRYTFSEKIFYWKRWRLYSFVPNVGVWYDHSQQIKEKGEIVKQSGGTLVNLQPGIEVFRKRLAFSASMQIPVYTDLSSGYLTMNNKFFAAVFYNF